MVEITTLETCHFLPTVALISGPIWHMSTNPDCLLKVKVINADILVMTGEENNNIC
jgi:hypothetical protein